MHGICWLSYLPHCPHANGFIECWNYLPSKGTGKASGQKQYSEKMGCYAWDSVYDYLFN